MNLILARHGNTFNAGDKVIWVGSANNIPLVGKGKEQAKHLAKYLKDEDLDLEAVYCGPLLRTKEYASIVVKEMGLKIEPIIDSRLNEFDYGKWSGLSSEEIIEKYGKTDLENWDKKSIWPPAGVWVTKEDEVIEAVKSFSDEISGKYGKSKKTILAISSNGKIRYFLSLVENKFAKETKAGDFKIKTGNICNLEFTQGLFSIDYWNKNPSEICKF